MIDWNEITSSKDIESLLKASFEKPVLVLKHSTTCSISSIAKMRLEDSWDKKGVLSPYLVKVREHRTESLKLSDTLDVHHESPQVLMISKGQCFYDVSHLDISMAEINDGLAEIS